jgi:hypothetical protein
MANNTGTLITAPIRPYTGSDTFPSAYANELLGGYHIAADTTARNAIPADRRIVGTLCYVTEENKTYILNGGIDNTNWAAFDAVVTFVPSTTAPANTAVLWIDTTS